MKTYRVFDQLHVVKMNKFTNCVEEFKFAGKIEASSYEDAMQKAKQVAVLPMLEAADGFVPQSKEDMLREIARRDNPHSQFAGTKRIYR